MYRWSLSVIGTLFLFVIMFCPTSARPEQKQGPAPKIPSEKKTEPSSDGRQGQLIMPKQGEEEDDGDREDITEGEERKRAKRTKEDIYIIKRGDTLWDISSSFLKDPFLWPLIWKVNPYIKNPDLIYPGNKLTIPSLAPIEKALEVPEERPPEKKIVEKEAAKVPPPVRPRKPEKPVEEEEEAPPRRILILPEEEKVPIINKYAMLNAGFVLDQETDDHIVGTLEPRTILGYDDIVFIRVKSRDDVQVSDRFLIYAPLHRVKHPRSGRTYGRLIKVLGILQVTATDAEYLTARITLSFDAAEKGDRITPYEEPVLIFEVPQKEKELTGYILEVVDGRTINAQMDIVYLDLGSNDGVEPGDRFNVYIEPRSKSFPKKLIGEIQVFLVKERTSTAVVSKSVDTLAKGDLIEFKK